MPNLFDPLLIRDVTLPNRIVDSPMCEYSSTDGLRRGPDRLLLRRKCAADYPASSRGKWSL